LPGLRTCAGINSASKHAWLRTAGSRDEAIQGHLYREVGLAALATATATIRAFAPAALVVALGLDAHEGDPYQTLAVTTSGFGRILAEVARLGLPTVLVQEGGYLSEDLGANLASALGGFERTA
jgi:acetoin utilization deacetylase AcuC-like enzyme